MSESPENKVEIFLERLDRSSRRAAVMLLVLFTSAAAGFSIWMILFPPSQVEHFEFKGSASKPPTREPSRQPGSLRGTGRSTSE